MKQGKVFKSHLSKFNKHKLRNKIMKNSNKTLATLLIASFTLVLLSFGNAEKCHICDFSDEPIIVHPSNSRGDDVDFDFSDEPIVVHPTSRSNSEEKDVVFDFSDEPIIVHPK